MTRDPAQPVEYWRFNIYHRLVHLLVLLSFFGSTISGLPLKYPSTGWAQWLTRLQGGVAVMGIMLGAAATYLKPMETPLQTSGELVEELTQLGSGA